MASSMYQNAGPPGAYRPNQPPPPPPPTVQYNPSNAYNYPSGQPSAYAANSGPHSQMAYNPHYGYSSSGAPYGPPGMASQNQYPPLPPYSMPAQPPPPPPSPLSTEPAAPPPPPLPPSSSLPPPPPPPLQPTSHHGIPYPPVSQAYQEGLQNSCYPPSMPSHSTQLPPHAPPSGSYTTTSQAPNLHHHTSGAATQMGSVPAVPPRQSTAQVPAANSWLSGSETSKVNLKPSAFVKPGLPSVHEKRSVSDMSKRPPPGTAAKFDNRSESEREYRERKRREYERKKMEEKKEAKVHSGPAIQKFPAGGRPLVKQTLGIGSKDARVDRKDKVENRLKRPSTFVCKVKFRNQLPDPVSQPKLLQVYNDKDRYCKYSITSLEKAQKHRLLVDSDLGIPLDLLDLSIYNAPKVKPPMDIEDEELLRDDEELPCSKQQSIRKKDRPTDKGVAWLVKTQYISPINLDPAKQALTEKQAKELKEMREGKRDFLVSLDREHQIRSIQESFRVAQQIPVHQTKPGLKPVEILPLLPDFERENIRLTHVTFDGEPTADSEYHSKLDRAVRDELEALAILKMYTSSNLETGKQERFLGYMVPKLEDLNSDYMNEMSYTWIREYHLEVRPLPFSRFLSVYELMIHWITLQGRPEETQNFSTYVFTFGGDMVQYLPLPQKISLRKKKAKERSKEDAESAFAIPSSVTVHRGDEYAEEEEERAAHRLSVPEVSHMEGRNSHGSKRRQSDDGEFARISKRREVNEQGVSDDEEDAYM